jgi:chemotaxis protein CheX
MAVSQTITDTHIQEFIIKAVKNVCSTMIRKEASFVEKSAITAYAGLSDRVYVFGSVGFEGEINGVVYLCITDDFARHAAAEILGMTPSEVTLSGDEVVRDVIGEITNMTVGGFKNALCDIGFPCKLTLPTVVRGDGMHIVSLKGVTRHIFQFDCANHRLVADIQLRNE